VLLKLGFDMRDEYEGLLNEPLPNEFARSLEKLST
jgi:hypothetical protein